MYGDRQFPWRNMEWNSNTNCLQKLKGSLGTRVSHQPSAGYHFVTLLLHTRGRHLPGSITWIPPHPLGIFNIIFDITFVFWYLILLMIILVKNNFKKILNTPYDIWTFISWPEIKPAPSALEGGVLTTGSPGKSHSYRNWFLMLHWTLESFPLNCCCSATDCAEWFGDITIPKLIFSEKGENASLPLRFESIRGLLKHSSALQCKILVKQIRLSSFCSFRRSAFCDTSAYIPVIQLGDRSRQTTLYTGFLAPLLGKAVSMGQILVARQLLRLEWELSQEDPQSICKQAPGSCSHQFNRQAQAWLTLSWAKLRFPITLIEETTDSTFSLVRFFFFEDVLGHNKRTP